MSELLQTLVLTSFSLVVCGFALWKGGAAERVGACAILAVIAIERLARLGLPAEFHPHLTLVGDGFLAVTFLILAVRFASPWLGAVMFFYAAQFTLHSVYLLFDRSPNDFLHVVLNNLNFAGIHICLVVGAAVAWRRRIRERRATAASASA